MKQALQDPLVEVLIPAQEAIQGRKEPLSTKWSGNILFPTQKFVQALQGEDPDTELGARLPKRNKRAWEADPDELDADRKEKEEEEARERDQREKEEFAERLRLRDEEKTKKIMEAKVSREQLEVSAWCMAFDQLWGVLRVSCSIAVRARRIFKPETPPEDVQASYSIISRPES